MIVAGHLVGDSVRKRYKIGATVADPGIIAIDGTAGIISCTTTDFGDTPGLILDTATYSTTQGDAEGVVSVDVNPYVVIKALMSGGATEGTALTTLVNTSEDTGGTTITDADVGSADMDSGTVWCSKGANLSQSRLITTHNSSTSFVVTVPFEKDIAANDEFLFCPWGLQGSGAGGSDGVGNLQTSTLFTQADASIASGTGGVVAIYDLELNGASDSYVLFLLGDHIFNVATI